MAGLSVEKGSVSTAISRFPKFPQMSLKLNGITRKNVFYSFCRTNYIK